MATLELLHWNDVHGRWANLAQLSARARAIRAELPYPVLLLDGGDIEEGSVRLSALSKGVAGWRMLGAAGVDAAVVGNGGLLRYGPQLLPRYADAVGSAPLVCDLDAAGSAPAGAAGSRIVTAGTLRVGVIGATDFYPQYLPFGLSERGRVTAVRAEADRLRQRGADVVILLSHCGLDADRSLSWAIRDMVDLVVGGHSHDVLEDGDFDHGVPIAQAGCHGERLGRVTIEVADGAVRVTSVRHEVASDSWPADPRVLDELDACERDLADWLAEPIAVLDTAVEHHELADSPISRLLAEALLDLHPGDLGMVIAGHCAQGLPRGKITRGDLWAATSSPGNVATATMSGADLRDMVRTGLSDDYAGTRPRTFRGRPYGRLQFAGAEIKHGELHISGAPVADDRRYAITSTDLELSPYGRLVAAKPDDLVVHVPAILPELLERYLRADEAAA